MPAGDLLFIETFTYDIEHSSFFLNFAAMYVLLGNLAIEHVLGHGLTLQNNCLMYVTFSILWTEGKSNMHMGSC